MLYFENDYCEGAHPAILQKLTETNFEKVSGYGTDPYCASAKAEDPRRLRLPGRRRVPSSPAAPRPTPSSLPPCCSAGRACWPQPPAMWPPTRPVPSSTPATRSSRLPAHEGKVCAADVRGLVRHLLCRRQPRPHGVPRHGVHLPPLRVRHPVHKAGAGRSAHRLSGIPDAAVSWTVPGWATA